MKCQNLFSRKNKKSIILSFAEFAQRVVKVNIYMYSLRIPLMLYTDTIAGDKMKIEAIIWISFSKFSHKSYLQVLLGIASPR